jgi:hypothetical protein
VTDVPLGGIAPGLMCSRLLRWPDESSRCPNEAAVHIMWTDDGENGLACSEHATELTRARLVDVHPYEPVCSIAGAIWIFGVPSYCVVDDIPVLVDERSEAVTA